MVLKKNNALKEMNTLNSVGYLELFIGPMWSGKTSELVKLYKRYKFFEVPVLAINYKHDIRYNNGEDNTICSHDLVNIPCNTCVRLDEVCDIVNGNTTHAFDNSQVILINECQFFKDVVQWVKCAVQVYNKQVFICGLDGDYKREVFGDWLTLIPFCDRVTKLHSLCGGCKQNDAIFTHRNTDVNVQELIGNDMYRPLCRKCYEEYNIVKHENS